jgi:predicted phosphohydrolase
MYQLGYKGQRIVVISDTHGKHRDLEIPPADIIIHCGDICFDGYIPDMVDFFHWFSELPIAEKLYMNGEHDFYKNDSPFWYLDIPLKFTLLENHITNINGISIGGLSSTFYQETTFAAFENKFDVLVTHKPPLGILDKNQGCEQLKNFVLNSDIKYHFFGHIHECQGFVEIENKYFANVAETLT